jgi:PD-(D/E)XK nuclease superfamily protein
MTIATQLKKAGAKRPKAKAGPVWGGPEQDGVTFSLLSRFLCCRERFRLLVVEGLKPSDHWNHRLGYGNLWHVCEEALAAKRDVQLALKLYASTLCRQYPTQQPDIEKWYNVCLIQFPQYVKFWAEHPDVVDRKPLLQEQVFDVPYKLPSGRAVRLRGKWDSVDLIGKGKGAGVYLQENKTKGQIDEGQLKRQLSFDLQTMTYLVALQEETFRHTESGILRRLGNGDILGVRYNVIRRPLSGGKGTIVQHKPSKGNPNGETAAEYYARLASIIAAESETYFMRWKCEVTPGDVAKFRRECLDPVLDNLADDSEWWVDCAERGEDVWDYKRRGDRFPLHRQRHFRFPFGVYNVLAEGGNADLDEFLATGSEVGLQRTDNLFPELE